MRFEVIIPAERLKPFVRQLVISEMAEAQSYKVFPSTGMVCGFQYRGSLSVWQDNKPVSLSAAGISGAYEHGPQTSRLCAALITVSPEKNIAHRDYTGISKTKTQPAEESVGFHDQTLT